MLSGATGQLYGSAYTWILPSGWLFDWRFKVSAWRSSPSVQRLYGWRSNLDTPGVIQLVRAAQMVRTGSSPHSPDEAAIFSAFAAVLS